VYVCGFFKSVIVARLLGDIFGSSEQYGIMSIFNNLHGIVTTVAILGLPVAIVKFGAEYRIKDKTEMNKIISVIFTLIIIISIIVSVCYFVLSEFIANVIYQQPILGLLIRIGTFTIIFASISAFGLAVLRGFQEIKALAIRNSVIAILQLPIAYVFVLQWHLVGAALVFLVNAIASVLILIGVMNSIFKKEEVKLKLSLDKRITKKLLNFSTPVFLSGFVLLPAILIINTYIALNIGYEDTGLFRIGYNLRTVFVSIPAVVSIPLLPMISESFVTNKRKVSTVIPKIMRLIAIVTLPIVLGIGIVIKYLITLVYGSIYEDAWLVAYLLLINAYIISSLPVLLTVFLSAGRTWTVLGLDILFVVIVIGLGFFLALSLELIGIALAFVFSGLIILFIEFIYLNRNFDIDFRSLMTPIIISCIFFGLSFILLYYTQGLMLIILDLILVGCLIIIEYFVLTQDEKQMLRDIIKKVNRKYLFKS
jgi:PST family polysaccharide transporter